MNRHLYLRAYMAGVAVPTVGLLVGFCVVQVLFPVPMLERALVFPLAIVPNFFGLWNMLYVKLQPHWHHPIGWHGAVLPFLIAPTILAFALAHKLVEFGSHGIHYFGFINVPYWYLMFAPFIAITAYYLLWKYLVGYLNRIVELPC